MTAVTTDETEVRRAKRSWPAQYKLDVLNEIGAAKASGEPGAVGEICRREGLALVADQQVAQPARARVPWRAWLTSRRAVRARTAPKPTWSRLGPRSNGCATSWPHAREVIKAQEAVSALLHDMSHKSAEPNTTKP
ncbi:MAG: hypothetical protein R2735_04395 [Microthrixaceae bacterium]